MSRGPEDFGSPTVSGRELRTVLITLSSSLAVLLLFGFGLAWHLRSPETTNWGVPVAREDSGPPVEIPPDPAVIAELSASRPVGTTPEAGPRFGVRVGIFGEPENADRVLLRLQSEGYAPFVVFDRTAGQTLRYVYAGSTLTETEATALAADVLATLGLDTHVEPVELPIR